MPYVLLKFITSIHIFRYNLYLTQYRKKWPVSVAERSKACTIYDGLNIEIAVSTLARGMDVCLRVSVLCCPVFR
jgi:hypothetical protein